MILVSGASGLLGTEICRQLHGQGQALRGLVRSTTVPEKIDALSTLGVELVYGDLKDRASLDIACTGVQTIISTATATISRQSDDSIPAVDQKGQMQLVEAARAAKVANFIFVSFSANIDAGPNPCPLTVAKRGVEECLVRSGMNYTILRPSYFMEIWLSPVLGFDYPNAQARICGDGLGKVSFISLTDVARFAVQCLENPAARNAILELGGPEALSPLDVVRIFEVLGGRKFSIDHVSMDTLQEHYAHAGDDLQKSFAALMLASAVGDVIDMTNLLKAFPIKLTTVRDYAQRMLP